MKEDEFVETINKIRTSLSDKNYFEEIKIMLNTLHNIFYKFNQSKKIIGTLFDNKLFNNFAEDNLLNEDLAIYKLMNWTATQEIFEFQTKNKKTNQKYFSKFGINVLELLHDPDYKNDFLLENTEITPEMCKIIVKTWKHIPTEKVPNIFKRSTILTSEHVSIAILGDSEEMFLECLDNKLPLTEDHLVSCLQKMNMTPGLVNTIFQQKVFDIIIDRLNKINVSVGQYFNGISCDKITTILKLCNNKEANIKKALLFFDFNVGIEAKNNTIALNSYGIVKENINKVITYAKLANIDKEYLDMYEKSEFDKFPEKRNKFAEELYFLIRSIRFIGNSCYQCHQNHMSKVTKKGWNGVPISINKKETDAWLSGDYDKRFWFLFKHQCEYFKTLLTVR